MGSNDISAENVNVSGSVQCSNITSFPHVQEQNFHVNFYVTFYGKRHMKLCKNDY